MKDNNKADSFYKNLKFISVLISLLLIYVLIDIGDYFNCLSNFYTDIRNLLIAILVGLLFSFLFTISSIREFILKSISNFMTDNSYIKKLGHDELKTLRENIMKEIHGVDIVSNGESLYNHLEQLDRFHSTPHKSIVNEKWIFSESEIADMFHLTRVQDYRIHTLDTVTHTEFDLLIKSQIHATPQIKEKIIESLKIIISINGQQSIEADSKSTNNKMEIDYNEEEEILSMSFNYKIPLTQEFTKVHVESFRIEEIEYSQAIYSSHATYGLNYDITLPEGYKYDDVYHSNTLDLKEENVSMHKLDKELSVNINGWQLPGLIFVYTYSKVK